MNLYPKLYLNNNVYSDDTKSQILKVMEEWRNNLKTTRN